MATDREKFPELFRDRSVVDQSKASRTTPMKVLVFGLMRTGTSSMCEPLAAIGIQDVYHMHSVCRDPDDVKWWLRAFRAKYHNEGSFGKGDWDQLLGHCQAVTDVPATCFAEELILAYPDAKVLLLERNVDAWYKSVIDTVLKPRPRLMAWFLSFLIYADNREMGQLVQLKDAIDRDFFGPKGLEESNVRKVYSEYHDRIRRLVPEERRLDFESKDGYESLCTFLGMDVPMEQVDGKEVRRKFPRVNEGQEFGARKKVAVKLAMKRVARKFVFGGLGIGTAVLVWKYWQILRLMAR